MRSCFDWHGMETPLSPPYVFTSFLSVAVALAILKVAVETEPTHVTTHTELYPEHLPAARTACFKSSPGWRRRAIALHSILYKGDADKDNSFSLERIFTVTDWVRGQFSNYFPSFHIKIPSTNIYLVTANKQTARVRRCTVGIRGVLASIKLYSECLLPTRLYFTGYPKDVTFS